MLRTLALALALCVPGIAAADQFPESAIGAEVVSDTGEVVGRVDHIQRDSDGRVEAVEIGGQEPASEPYVSRDLVAERDGTALFVSDRRDDRHARAASSQRAHTR